MTQDAAVHAPAMIDIAGTRLDDGDRRRIAHRLVGGVILFARNFATGRN